MRAFQRLASFNSWTQARTTACNPAKSDTGHVKRQRSASALSKFGPAKPRIMRKARNHGIGERFHRKRRLTKATNAAEANAAKPKINMLTPNQSRASCAV